MHRAASHRANILRALAAAATVFVAGNIPASGATIWVNASGGNDAGSCGSSASPCRTIQRGVDRAVNGDTVRVKPGTYREFVSMTKRITLLSDAFANMGDRATTIIDCTGVCDRASGRYTPPVYAGDGCTVTGFTIKNAGGSGIEAVGSVTITNNAITGNQGLSTSHGGGINFYSSVVYSSTGTARIENNEIFDNAAPAQGGGIFVRARSRSDRGLRPVVIQNNNIHDNRTTTANAYGSGVFVRLEGINGGRTDVAITQNTISGNTNTAGADPVYYPWGGGISAGLYEYGNHKLAITNNTIENNRAAVGGAASLITGTSATAVGLIEFAGNALRNNTAQDAANAYGFGGGAFAYAFGWGTETLSLHDNVVTGNVSRLTGGGLDVRVAPGSNGSQSVTVQSNVVTGNRTAEAGGGIFASLTSDDVPAGMVASLNLLDNNVSSNSATGSLGSGEPLGRGAGVFASANAARSSATGVSFLVRGNRIVGNRGNLAGGGLDISALTSSLADPDIPGSTARSTATTLRAQNNLIAGNIVASPDAVDYPSVGGGLFVHAAAQGQATSLVFADFNTVHGNVSDVGAGGVEVESETLYDTQSHQGAASFTARNNIVAANSGFGVGGPQPGQAGVVTNGGTGNLALEFHNDDLHANTDGGFEGWIGAPSGFAFTGNVSVDPRFKNPAAGDFRLMAGSPLIDAGGSAFSPIPATDFEGDARVVDGDGNGVATPDVGWDEYSQAMPNADAGPDSSGACDVPSGRAVTLNGTLSSDADSSPGSNDDIAAFEWFENYGGAGQTLLGSGATLNVVLPIGNHTITLRVEDTLGAADTDTVVIGVFDADGDAVCVFADNCPAVSNPTQADTDADGVGDACDVETCDLLDNDGDGSIDEDLGSTTCGVGSCQRTTANCESGAPRSCVAGAPANEACNGSDDDCDGLTDENLGALSCGVGACHRVVNACDNGVPGMCTPGTPSAEICNGIDDDCDGSIDENLAGGPGQPRCRTRLRFLPVN